MASQPTMTSRPMTFDEYQEFESASDIRHEFVDGEIYAFADASRRHSRIVTNITMHLAPAAGRASCELHAVDVKLQAAHNVIYYPDVMVTCDPADDGELIVTSPCLVIEVVSPSTETVDLREKLLVYRQIETLRTYLIVRQDRRTVTRHWRDQDGNWWWGTLTKSGSMPVDCLETEISLDQIYQGIDELQN